ncbi:MAG: M23 family metallopeptidase [Bacteroidota bacterium]
MNQKIAIIVFFVFCIGVLLVSWGPSKRPSSPEVHHCGIKHHLADSNVQQLFPSISDRLFDSIFHFNAAFLSDGFDFPVGKPDGHNYYKALEFKQKNHLGEDWNGLKGGDTDLGDPVFSTANGLVTFSMDVCCGWGKVVRIAHRMPSHPKYKYVETICAHLDQINVQAGDLVQRGQQIGTIGTADGKYSAHLHLELRDFVNMSLGPGYSDNFFGYLAPTTFINSNRPNK